MRKPPAYDDDLRDSLVDAATAAIADRGVEALSLRKVAAQCGTTTYAIYTLIGSKDALIGLAATRARQSFICALVDSERHRDPLRDIRAIGYAYRDWALSNPAMFTMLFGGQVHPEATPHRASTPPGEMPAMSADDPLQPLLERVRRALALCGRREAPPEVVAANMWATSHGQLALEMLDPDPDRLFYSRMYDLALDVARDYWFDPPQT